ncbi:hypothetical protein NitYY0826_C0563 [Nitratiruptor sp. YY08-26]|nr:hypothetical protein NitYY0813_C0561 [Nitratiruptor sp. YY08-13]BCD65636.1 hypothetical protein NitYY0826_C0563 [Nitratiruptor sp. YY08-26]
MIFGIISVIIALVFFIFFDQPTGYAIILCEVIGAFGVVLVASATGKIS